MPSSKFVSLEERQEQKHQRNGKLIVCFFIFVLQFGQSLFTDQVKLGKEGFRAIIAFIIGIVLIILFETLYLFITKRNKKKGTVSSNNGGGKRLQFFWEKYIYFDNQKVFAG